MNIVIELAIVRDVKFKGLGLLAISRAVWSNFGAKKFRFEWVRLLFFLLVVWICHKNNPVYDNFVVLQLIFTFWIVQVYHDLSSLSKGKVVLWNSCRGSASSSSKRQEATNFLIELTHDSFLALLDRTLVGCNSDKFVSHGEVLFLILSIDCLDNGFQSVDDAQTSAPATDPQQACRNPARHLQLEWYFVLPFCIIFLLEYRYTNRKVYELLLLVYNLMGVFIVEFSLQLLLTLKFNVQYFSIWIGVF